VEELVVHNRALRKHCANWPLRPLQSDGQSKHSHFFMIYYIAISARKKFTYAFVCGHYLSFSICILLSIRWLLKFLFYQRFYFHCLCFLFPGVPPTTMSPSQFSFAKRIESKYNSSSMAPKLIYIVVYFIHKFL
jgi:hypothetical protein